MASREGDRIVALSAQLAQAHQELRRYISEIKSGLGRRRLSDDALVTHCLAFCEALTSHHQGEDAGMFSALLRERPDLAVTVAKLVEDHGMIASILSRVRELADRAADSRDLAAESIGRELDGLAAIMESHFGYEERTLSDALDAGVPDTGWSETVFWFGAS
ncbi:hemerythrin domain-containing protein [Actinospica sp.]|jgi:hemerythrin-like domain-containing protein|uniref:hemerythrin domain-containing protein n=1 Tax=Actinospica sp. TaxID=1872142 RepID=UPI002BC6E481|nr:hemerythrin domain-containing protein [Actinospica sp.]HWG23578.1 hemerythrin domain-containing protein [Actinospica sp.]